jgi:hypothetical protein
LHLARSVMVNVPLLHVRIDLMNTSSIVMSIIHVYRLLKSLPLGVYLTLRPL